MVMADNSPVNNDAVGVVPPPSPQVHASNWYALNTLLHELLLTSEHRTFDPEEADFFFVSRGESR